MTLRMPAEWEKQQAIWLAWPHNKEDWPGKFEAIKWVYVELIKYLTQGVRVRLLVEDAVERQKAVDILTISHIDLSQVDLIIAPTDRSWLRDSGPVFVYNGTQRTLLDWRFNAWAKYNNWQSDDKVPEWVKKFLDLPSVQPEHKGRRVVLEGGSIEVNGKGTLITTEECLLSDIQCRNPGFSREDYEQIFVRYLGISHVIWLGNGIEGDDTHGHIDDLARFVNATTAVTVIETDKNERNYAPLHDNLKRLKAACDQDGKKLDIIELPMPKKNLFDGQILPASYANFLISNNTVLVPTFNDPNDRIALDLLAGVFPKHNVVGIYCGDFILGLGTIHCASQQECA